MDARDEKQSQKTTRTEQPKSTGKKPATPADDLAGFREFAAIAGAISAPIVVSAPTLASSQTAGEAFTKEAAGAEFAKSGDEAIATPNRGSTGRDNEGKLSSTSGQGWLAVVMQGTALLLFATSIYQGYAVYTGDLPVAAGVAIIAALIAACVTMIGLSLAVRLLAQIANDVRDRDTHRQSE